MDIENRQRSLLGTFTAERLYLLDGLVAVEFAGGIGGNLRSFRRGREASRPLLVSLEAKREGLFLGLTVSRPRNGRLLYGQTIARWDISVPFSRGPMNMKIPQHRRAAFWGVRMAERLLAATDAAQMRWPAVLVPFKSGEEKIIPGVLPAVLEQHEGQTLVSAEAVEPRFVESAINADQALEDYRAVAGTYTELAAGTRLRHEPLTQIVAVEDVSSPPWPHAGDGLPALNWPEASCAIS